MLSSRLAELASAASLLIWASTTSIDMYMQSPLCLNSGSVTPDLHCSFSCTGPPLSHAIYRPWLGTILSTAIIVACDGTVELELLVKVRYHQDEDPKTLKVFPIPLHDSNGTTLQYDRLSISPDGRILAVTNGSTLQWLSAETGQVLDAADRAHDGDITDMAWAPRTIPNGDKQAFVLATASLDKKVKLWAAPPLHPS